MDFGRGHGLLQNEVKIILDTDSTEETETFRTLTEKSVLSA
jgi:hypothetical protein